VKYRQLYLKKNVEGDSHWNYVELADGTRRVMTNAEISSHALLGPKDQVYRLMSLYPAGFNKSGVFEVSVKGRTFWPQPGQSWFTNPEGMRRLVAANRVEPYEDGKTLNYVLKLRDYESTPLDLAVV
jgi:adenine-specific DNA-methyltransferase